MKDMKAFGAILAGAALAGCLYGHPVTGILPRDDGEDEPGSELLSGLLLAALAAGGGASQLNRFVAVGDGGVVYYSDDDGQNWTAGVSGVAVTLNSVTYIGNNRWVAVGSGGTVLYSDDGAQTWTAGTGTGTESFPDVASDGSGRAIVVSSTNDYVTTDGVNWSVINVGIGVNTFGIFYGCGHWVVTAINAASFSTDGVNFTAAGTPPTGQMQKAACNPATNRFVAVIGNAASAEYSNDANTWVPATVGPATRQSVLFQNVPTASRRFVAVGGNASIYGTSDGVNWAIIGTAANAKELDGMWKDG